MVGGTLDELLSSSETVTYSPDSMAAWSPGWTLHPDSLLPARNGLKASRVGGTVHVTGGGDDHGYLGDILVWHPELASWSQVGDMGVPRRFHAITSVDYDSISAFCVHS